MKQLKEIFQRKTSIWLALELILVTIACWWAFDPVIVTTYVTRLPLGYDADRLVRMEVASTLPSTEARQRYDIFRNEEQQLLEKVQKMDEVEMAYLAYNNSIGTGVMNIIHNFYDKLGHDSIHAIRYGFVPDSKMFQVYGLQSLTPAVPTNELTHDCQWEKTVIITRTVAMGLFGTLDVAGRTIVSTAYAYNEEISDFKWEKVEYTIRAVVEDVRYGLFDRDYAVVFLCETGPSYNIPIFVRLREGVNADRFVQASQLQVQHEMVTEHCYVRGMKTLQEASHEEYERTRSREVRRNLLIAAFFALNLAFGVFGTLLMYTRQRREEAGVKRAFGATRWSVFWDFIREAWLLTTISVVIGCIIYFQFAVNGGLFGDFDSDNPINRYWFDDFGTHFLVVSVIVYLIILCAVLIATAIPAWCICRSEITEALKDE